MRPVILVLTGEVAIRESFESLLTGEGHDVVAAATATEALHALVEERAEALRALEICEGELARERSRKTDALAELSGRFAHELNNLLAVITSFADLVDAALAPRDPSKRDIAEVITASKQAAALTQQLLRFSRQQPADFEVVDVNAAVERLGRWLGADEAIAVDVVLAGAPAMVAAASIELDAVLINLARNARELMSDGSTLRLSVAVAEDQVRIDIANTGAVIDERARGAGLKLATCYGVVARLGGTIEVTSAPGVGAAAVTVRLPRAQALD